jgi:hypothetical protein
VSSVTERSDGRSGTEIREVTTHSERPSPALAGQVGNAWGYSIDHVESALAKALEGATAAGRWDVVAQLARELEARRLARTDNVVNLDVARRGGKWDG